MRIKALFAKSRCISGTYKGAVAISTVVFKLRVINPRSRDAPARNQAHMEYIGRRRGVVLNEGMKHGLFGTVDGKPAESVSNLQELSRHIGKKTREGTIAYRAVISLAEADAVRLGFDDRAKWQELVARKLPDMADKLGIPIHNLEYTAAVHMDKGHPHCHILFWDKEQGVKKPYVHPSVSNKIRVDLIKHVFGEEMGELQQIKNEARKAAIENAGGFFDGFLDTFADMTPKEYTEAVERLKRERDLADGKLIYGRFPTAAMNELAADLFRLADLVPKTGRLNMKLMPPEVEVEIEAFVEKLLDLNDDCDREFKRYANAAIELSKYYTDKPEAHAKAGQSAYDDMMNRLSNAVLRGIKKINQQERGMEWEAKQEAHRRQMIESLVTEIFSILARSANAADRQTSYARRTGELSKQAKKELAMRLENSSGYDWER